MKKLSLVLAIVFATGQLFAQTINKSKFGKGLKFMGADSSFTMKFHYRQQQLFIGEYNDVTEQQSSNFLVRRSRLKFSGYAFDPRLTYKAEIGLTNRDISQDPDFGSDASRLILDAVLKYQFSKHWAFWVGQTKLPGNRERVVSSANLQFVDRSLVNSRFNIDRDMGVQLRGKFSLGNVHINPSFALSQGEGRDVTDGNQGGLCYTGHVDFLPLGKFANKGDYISSDLEREQKPKLSIGLTYNYNDRAVRQGGQLKSYIYDKTSGEIVTNSMSNFMADLFFKYKGLSIASEFAIRTAEKEITNTTKNFNTGAGFNLQAGYLFKNNWEISSRFTTIDNDGNFSGLKGEEEYTIGLSKYIVGHSLKVQTDISKVETFGVLGDVYRMRMQMEMQF